MTSSIHNFEDDKLRSTHSPVFWWPHSVCTWFLISDLNQDECWSRWHKDDYFVRNIFFFYELIETLFKLGQHCIFLSRFWICWLIDSLTFEICQTKSFLYNRVLICKSVHNTLALEDNAIKMKLFSGWFDYAILSRPSFIFIKNNTLFIDSLILVICA